VAGQLDGDETAPRTGRP